MNFVIWMRMLQTEQSKKVVVATLTHVIKITMCDKMGKYIVVLSYNEPLAVCDTHLHSGVRLAIE